MFKFLVGTSFVLAWPPTRIKDSNGNFISNCATCRNDGNAWCLSDANNLNSKVTVGECLAADDTTITNSVNADSGCDPTKE